MTTTERPGTAGPALLLVHGFLDDRTVWNRVIAQLSGRLAVIPADLPGWGERKDDDGPFTLERFGQAVAEEVDAADGPVVLVGHSMGAIAAELAAAARPEKVTGLILLTPVPLAGAHLDAATAEMFRTFGGNAAAQREGRRAITATADEAALDELVRTGMLARPETVAATFDAWNDGLPGGNRPTEYPGPTLIVRGTADTFVTGELLRTTILNRFPGAERREIAGAGHLPHVEKPADTAALLEEFALRTAGEPDPNGLALTRLNS